MHTRYRPVRTRSRPSYEILNSGLRGRRRDYADFPCGRSPTLALGALVVADYQPHAFVIDAQGRVVTSYEGRGDAEIWESLAAQLP